MGAIVTLTTDFGTADSYVAEMKGVLLSQGPEGLRLVDLSHEVAPQDVRGGALLLGAAVPRFPAGTVHLAVVDPGVGSARRALVARIAHGWLVAPDNGLGTRLFDPDTRCYALDPAKLSPAPPSATFHGRDVFAPAAARLAAGEPVEAFASPLGEPVRLEWPAPQRRGAALYGEVIHVDRFGNLITNLDGRDLPQGHGAMWVESRRVGPILGHYAEVEVGALLALVGSSGLVEIGQRNGNAARATGASLGSAVRLEPGP